MKFIRALILTPQGNKIGSIRQNDDSSLIDDKNIIYFCHDSGMIIHKRLTKEGSYQISAYHYSHPSVREVIFMEDHMEELDYKQVVEFRKEEKSKEVETFDENPKKKGKKRDEPVYPSKE